jgi:hypothetical protein
MILLFGFGVPPFNEAGGAGDGLARSRESRRVLGY